ncbi:MAG TPA: hypothetical protein PK835_03555 [Caldisericia bacterium]|nr:hypothetical protein [Caldisericia bacterium]HQG59523.1 hypothetical protein [Caldisericia bacterium]HQH48908.1 hypothetical protein [Caldisericia bacterium]HQJ44522.1 hypothetical protein [Caldisericia bacterium]
MAKQKIIVISGTMIVTAVIAVLLVARLTQNGKLVSQSNGSYLPVNPKTAIPEIADNLVDSDKFSFTMYQSIQDAEKLFYIGWEGNNTAFVLKRYDIPSKQLTNLTNSDSSIHKIAYPGGNRIYLSKYTSKNKLYDLYSYDLLNQQLTNITNSENYSEIIIGYTNEYVLLDIANLATNADPKHNKYSIYKTSNNTFTTFLDTTNTVHGMEINGNKIVWSEGKNGNSDIFMYDIVTGHTSTICDDPSNQEYPDISGDYIVWCDHRNDYHDYGKPRSKKDGTNSGDIYAHRISTGETFPVENTNDSSIYPQISGSIATWHMSKKGSVGELATIMVADLSIPKITPIPASSQISHKYPPLIDGDLVVWMDMRQYKLGKTNIYGYRISSRTEIQLTNTNGRDKIEWLSSPYLVYNHNTDIKNQDGRGDLHIIKIR